MTNDYLITVIIPVYNADIYIRPALASIIQQTYQKLEIIIVDDGSTDNCMDYVRDLIENDYRTKVIKQKNSGKSVAINNALDMASGDFWLIQDADDISYPDRIARQLNTLINSPELAAVYVGHDIILNEKQFAPKYEKLSSEQCDTLIQNFKMPAHDATGMYRVSMVNNMRFDPELRIGQGVDFVLRTGEKYPIALLGECLYTYRINYNSTIRKDPINNIEKINLVIQKACKRRGLNYTNHKLVSGTGYKSKIRAANNHLISHCMDSVICLKRNGKITEAIRVGLTCVRLNFIDYYNYKPLLYSLMPLYMIQIYKKLKRRA